MLINSVRTAYFIITEYIMGGERNEEINLLIDKHYFYSTDNN